MGTGPASCRHQCLRVGGLSVNDCPHCGISNAPPFCGYVPTLDARHRAIGRVRMDAVRHFPFRTPVEGPRVFQTRTASPDRAGVRSDHARSHGGRGIRLASSAFGPAPSQVLNDLPIWSITEPWLDSAGRELR